MKRLFLLTLALAAGLGLHLLRAPGGQRVADDASLDAQYAAAKLRLAEANLARVERMNRRVANVVPASVVDDYRRDVAVAQARVAQGAPDAMGVWLQEVERDWRAADAAWRSAEAANDRTRGTVDPLDVDRLRLRAEVLRLNLERGRSLQAQPREAQIAWRISALNDELEQLVETVRRSPPRRPASTWVDPFFWGPR